MSLLATSAQFRRPMAGCFASKSILRSSVGGAAAPKSSFSVKSRHRQQRCQLRSVALKSDQIEARGEVVKTLPGDYYSVQLENGFTIRAYPSGKVRVRQLQIVPGDQVTVELSVYDLTKGRILERHLTEAEERARLENMVISGRKKKDQQNRR